MEDRGDQAAPADSVGLGLARWDVGRATIDDMLSRHQLESVPASRAQAWRLIGQARKHAVSAEAVADTDPEGGCALAYDAARKALAAVLECQGLRVTSERGHHQTLYQAVLAQLDPPMGQQLRPFLAMKERRRKSEYPGRVDESGVSADDVRDDAKRAAGIVEDCAKVIDLMPRYTP